MGWAEYYTDKNIIPLGAQRHGYCGALDHLIEGYPEILDQGHPLTWVLGGCHPNNSTAQDFSRLCQDLHPHPDDQHIVVDMNPSPLTLGKLYGLRPVQGKLEDLPFGANSIDFLLLDCTLQFMKSRQIKDLATNLERTLTPNGIVLATSRDFVFPFIHNFSGLFLKEVFVCSHSEKELEQLTTPHLKTVLLGTYRSTLARSFIIQAFAKPGHQLPPFSKQPPFHFSSQRCYPQLLATAQPSFT